MYGLMNWQYFQEQSRRSQQAAREQRRRSEPPRPVLSLTPVGAPGGRTAAPAMGSDAGPAACCPDPVLELEPTYPYGADWRPRCQRCGRWHVQGALSPKPGLLLPLAAEERRAQLRPSA